jgi:WD repeat-containing protein 81
LDLASGQVAAEWMVPFQHHSGAWGTGNMRSMTLGHHNYNASEFGRSISNSSIPSLWLAVGSTSGAIALLDARTGILMEVWKAHEGQVLKLTPFGSHYLLSSSTDKTITQWDLRFSPPQLYKTYKGHADPVVAMSVMGEDLVSASGHKLGRVSLNNDDVVGNVVKFNSHRVAQSKSTITSLEVLKYHELMLVGSEDGVVKVCY